MVEWGLYHGEEQASRDAVFILSSANSKYSRGLIKTALLDSEVKEEVKRVLIYVWIFDGNKEKFGATVGSFYTKIKPRKVVCEKFDDGMIYFSAYALCIARIAFWETENLDVVGKVCDKVYKSLKGRITESEVTNEELAALMLSECKYKWVKSLKDVTGLFEITKQKLEKLKEMLKGENNG
jgi:hypothetical protein